MIIDKDKLKNSVGQVLSLKDGIVRIKGLDNVKANEMLLFQGGLYGLAINLEFNTIGALIFDKIVMLMQKIMFLVQAKLSVYL